MRSKQQPRQAKKAFLLILSLLLCFPFYSNNTIIGGNNRRPEKTHPLFKELVALLDNRKCLEVNITALTTKKDAAYAYSYTSHGIGFLMKENNNTIKSTETKMGFSNRSFFNGKKTIEAVRITTNGNSLSVEIHFKTWSNTVVLLSSVKITKNKFGFSITGDFINLNKTSYYTISIYEVPCF
ncbi:MAG: hypothetical protein V3U92_09280 [Cellulophaga sp.]